MSFSLNVAKWAAEAGEDMAALNKAIILELFTAVILDTPVLEGRLRGNWIISSDNPANGTLDVIDPDGKKTTKKVGDFVSKFDGSKDFNVFLANNLPYAYRVEYDGWSHTKAPAGMVRKNLIRISNNLAAA
tara:strand:+ start:570 stop:962 length:393 start_codon:yes stop_codon:yes gene_type:complete